ncbi:FAD:protein FMN transferase [Dermatophilaceae bacterium Soc4.6]
MSPTRALAHPATAEAASAPVLDRAHGSATWRALGTYVDVRTTPDALSPVAALVADVLDEVDHACSRFREDSDLTWVNRLEPAGTPVAVSPVLLAAVRVALEAADETGGLVDPTLGALLVAGGYDCTFTRLALDDQSPATLPAATVAAPVEPAAVDSTQRQGGWAAIVVTATTVSVPAGLWLDLGATGKAFAADLAAVAVEEAFGVPVVVGVGGDVRVAGSPHEWGGPAYDLVLGETLADLEPGGVQTRLTLRGGGLATSSTVARRWRRGGRQWHHLLDPRTGAPASGPWRTVTALGQTAAAANTASTAAVVLGDDALPWLDERGVAARLVDRSGSVARTPAWVASGVEHGRGIAS